MSLREGKARKMAADSSPTQRGKSVVEELVQHVVSFAFPQLYRMEPIQYGKKVSCLYTDRIYEVGVFDVMPGSLKLNGNVFANKLDCLRACVVQNHMEQARHLKENNFGCTEAELNEIINMFQTIWRKEDIETLKPFKNDMSDFFELFMLESIRRLTGEQEQKDIFEYVRVLPEDSLNLVCKFQTEMLSLLFKVGGSVQKGVQPTFTYNPCDDEDGPTDYSGAEFGLKIWKPKVLDLEICSFEGWAKNQFRS